MAINISECDDYRFGKNCSKQCGHCYNNSSCHHINGTCVEGCDRGYQGTKCMQSMQRLYSYYFNVYVLHVLDRYCRAISQNVYLKITLSIKSLGY